MDHCQRLSDISYIEVQRFTSTINYLDLCYGFDGHTKIIGFPCGGVSLWAGSPGVGKTRLTLELCRRMNAKRYRLLYIQMEANLQQFRQWIGKTIASPDDFYVSSNNDVLVQVDLIYRLKPKIVFIDSLNMIRGHNSSSALRVACDLYRKAASETGTHIVLIGHLNKEGKVKGNNDIIYLVDIVCLVDHFKLDKKTVIKDNKILDGLFVLSMSKSRYGAVTYNGIVNYVLFRHCSNGVEAVTSNFAP